MKYLENKSFGFYVSIAAAILALAGLILYRKAMNTERVIVVLLASSVGIWAAAAVFLAFVKGNRWLNLVITADAVMVAGAMVLSLCTQVDALGYVVSGLYGVETVQFYVMSAMCMAISLILYVISSYYGFEKDRM